MGTSDFLLSFFSTFPTSLSNLCINFPFFFCLFSFYLWSWFLLPWNLIQTERIRTCGSPVVSRKSWSRHRWFLHGWFLSDIFHPHLICDSHIFYSASLQCFTAFQQFSFRGRDGFCYRANLTSVFITVYLKIDFVFQWSRRGEVISALYSQKGWEGCVNGLSLILSFVHQVEL